MNRDDLKSFHAKGPLYALDDYQRDAMRTAARAPGEEVSDAVDVAVRALGLVGEAGEVADLIKKELGHGHPLVRGKLEKELGDVLWYLATLAHAYGLSLSDIAHANVDKLRARFPEGFTHERSRNREGVES